MTKAASVWRPRIRSSQARPSSGGSSNTGRSLQRVNRCSRVSTPPGLPTRSTRWSADRPSVRPASGPSRGRTDRPVGARDSGAGQPRGGAAKSGRKGNAPSCGSASAKTAVIRIRVEVAEPFVKQPRPGRPCGTCRGRRRGAAPGAPAAPGPVGGSREQGGVCQAASGSSAGISSGPAYTTAGSSGTGRTPPREGGIRLYNADPCDWPA